MKTYVRRQQATTRMALHAPMVEGSSRDLEQPSYIIKQGLNAQISTLENEISTVDAEIQNLNQRKVNLISERKGLLRQLESVSNGNHEPVDVSRKGKKMATDINYTESFDWTNALKARMKAVFGIEHFRLCQEALVPLMFAHPFTV